MPALTLSGRKWHIASDDIPLFAFFGALFYAAWVVLIGIGAGYIWTMPGVCRHPGRQYIAAASGLFILFVLGFILELLLIMEGCRGMHALTVNFTRSGAL